ncbi:ubiquitin carboxyl-terminal hydrolase 5/13 [Nematocida displodere]|uniref:Ubiquitin carboxyl-terminal hydrolase 5/13 n=1 Tax=Nematocida displodere TaxID=1805483 RepID=A0A177EFS8_9MICR|nr:ubiquitin carboxyl-terminal hydrolase 5/13 [Nematocida displodere]
MSRYIRSRENKNMWIDVECWDLACVHCDLEKKETGAVLCECGGIFCQTHIAVHHYQKHLTLSIEGGPKGRRVELDYAKDPGSAACFWNLVQEKIFASHVVPGPDSRSIYGCVHVLALASARTRKRTSLVLPSIYQDTSPCCYCSLRVNRWLCMVCGLLFCGNPKYGLEGNQHVDMHFSQTEHCLFMNMDLSPTISEHNSVFCRMCEEFVNCRLGADIFRHMFTVIRGCFKCNPEAKKEHKKKHLCSGCLEGDLRGGGEEKEKKLGVTKKGGVKNIDGSCYIASVLLCASFVLTKTQLHKILPAKTCSQAPDSCFGCLLARLLFQLAHMHLSPTKFVVSIAKIKKRLAKAYPNYNYEDKNDPARCFRHIICLAKKHETPGHPVSLSRSFFIVSMVKSWCPACNQAKEAKDQVFIIYLKPYQTVTEFFSVKHLNSECTCTAKPQIAQTTLLNIPRIVVVRRKRTQQHILGDRQGATIDVHPVISYHISKENQKKMNLKVSTDASQRKAKKTFHDAVPEIQSLFDELFPNEALPSSLLGAFYNSYTNECIPESLINQEASEDGAYTGKLQYTLVAAVIYQASDKGGKYFAQTWGETTPPDITKPWTTINDEKITKEPFFHRDATLMFYVWR